MRRFFVDDIPGATWTWSVLEGMAGGSMNGSTYTAPSGTGTFHVKATSTADPSTSETATVTVVTSGFRPADDMVLARTAHTATLLPNGSVLIAGGDPCWLTSDGADPCPLEETELYDPAIGIFLSTGNMFAKRSFHTATLLPGGKVLIAGGGSASAELYEPTTGAFAMTGSMSVNRSAHTATLLSNGKVLIAGGQSAGSSISTAELYDPLTGTFSPTGGTGMTVPRHSHTATGLANGNVLITGGRSSGEISESTAELYDPIVGTFAATGSMTVDRTYHTATLLGNGTVLITGGVGTPGINERPERAEIYNLASGRFSATDTMLTERLWHVAILLPNGNVLVTGGSISSAVSGPGPQLGFTTEIYDPSTGSLTQTGSMKEARLLAAAVALVDGRVLVTGGSDFVSAELYQ